MAKDKVRVAAVQHQLRGIRHRDEFREQVSYLVGAAAGYGVDFVVLPELFTMQLLSLEPARLGPREAMVRIDSHTEWYSDFMRALAVQHRVNIVGGTHVLRHASGEMRNVAFVFLRDGSVHRRDKIHPTPSEAAVWGIRGGDAVDVIETDCGPVGVLVCYDVEFPELPRRLADQGAPLLLVPFCTDDRRGFLRVRYCCHARAIENQTYVLMAGVCGNLPNVENMDVHYAESAIITPCDIPFARDGIAAEASANIETIVVADLDLAELARARIAGSVRNFNDRRRDLYRIEWLGSATDARKAD
ncbi:MAG: carbon-nitrogen hydrolase family protein [Hyphomicrobiaceae bacterium]